MAFTLNETVVHDGSIWASDRLGATWSILVPVYRAADRSHLAVKQGAQSQLAVKQSVQWLLSQENTTSLLAQELHNAYSIALYGATGRIPPLSSLRVLWPSLLSPVARAGLRGHVHCNSSSAEITLASTHSYLFIEDLAQNFLNGAALWLRHPLAAPARAPMAADHEWVEATHCFYFHAREHTSRSSPMWFFAAPGAGISINVGRTLVVREADYGAAVVRALHRSLRASHKLARPVRRKLLGGPVKNAEGRRAVEEILGPLIRAMGAAFAPPYDSVQLEQTAQASCSWEQFVEIVVLGWGKELSYLPSYLNQTAHMRCGRHPHLRPCALSDAAVRVHGPVCARGVPTAFRSEIHCPAKTSRQKKPTYWDPWLEADSAEVEAKRLLAAMPGLAEPSPVVSPAVAATLVPD